MEYLGQAAVENGAIDSLAVQIAAVIVALTSLVGAIGALLNRRSLSTKAVNGKTNIFGRPKKQTIGDVLVAMSELTDRTDEIARVVAAERFDKIEANQTEILTLLKRRR